MEVLAGDLGTKQLPSLPVQNYSSSMVLHNESILLSGGVNIFQKCLQFDNGTWKQHSTFNRERADHSVVTTQTATFVFGGRLSYKTYEYLPKNGTRWLMGKTKIPRGFWNGCAIAVKSGEEIWLIGGHDTENRILCFHVNDHTFQILPFDLNVGRRGPRCAFIPKTNKIMITGGYSIDFVSLFEELNSTEIMDIDNGSVTMASPMNSKRYDHGMGVVTINHEDRLAAFGGYARKDRLDSFELYDSKTEKWETTDIKLNQPKSDYGFLSVKLAQFL